MTVHEPNGAGTLSLDEMFAAREERARLGAADQAQAARREQERRARERGHFETRILSDADRDGMLRKIEAAFEGGQREMMLVSFPSDYCRDGGRRINNRLPGWQETLPAGAQVFLEFWRGALRQGGFGLGARVLDFPGGMLGHVGLFVTWPQSRG